MPDVRVQDEQGTIHVFPDGSTPQMIAQAMNVKPPDLQGALARERVENAKTLPAQYQPPDNSYGAQVRKNIQSDKDFYAAAGSDIKNAVTSPSTYMGPAVSGGIDAVKQLYQAAKAGKFQAEPRFLDQLGGALGINTQGVSDSASQGSLGGVVGHAALPIAQVAGAGATPAGEGAVKASAELVNPARQAFNRAKVMDAEKALDAALPAKAGVNTASEFATPEVVQRIRETAARSGITEPSAANLKKAVDQVVVENRVKFHQFLDPVANVPATVPLMPPPVMRKLIANVELNNPDVAARMKSGQTTLGDLDVIRQRINQDTKYPATNSSETAMNSALKDTGAKIRDRLYPQLESLNNLPPDTLRDLKAEEGKFMQLQPLTDKYNAAISKYASKEATKGMLEKFSGGARGTMGGSIGSAVGGTVGMAVGGPPGAAVGGSVGAVAGRLLAGKEGKVAESQRLMRAVFGQQ